MTNSTLPQPKLQDHEHFMATLGTVAKCARERFPDASDRIDRAIQLVIDGGVTLHHDGTATVRSQTKPDVQYHVNGRCECPDTADWCKHKFSAGILKRVIQRLADLDAAALSPVNTQCWQPVDQEGTPWYLVAGDCPHTATAPVSDADLLAPYVVQIHGKAFVQYAGLLKLATARGLTRLEARFISVTAELALAEATATFSDGRVFSESSDSTPENVGIKIRPHFPRMALTRAKSRCLRDALGIDMTALEELGE